MHVERGYGQPGIFGHDLQPLTAIPRGVHVDASRRFRWLVLLMLVLVAWEDR